MNKIILFIISSILFLGFSDDTSIISNKKSNPLETEFSFIFMTDIHLQPEKGAITAFNQVIDTANQLQADFVMTGGDLVYDVLRGNFERSDSLFRLYKNTIKRFNMPVYHCIGNHELFGIYPESDIDSTHKDYKYGMFERHLGKTYYSFNHKGWHFIVLNSIDEKDQKYIGIIDSVQLQWLREDLASIDPKTPVAVTLHIPLITTYNQIYGKQPITEVPNELWIQNRQEVLELLWKYNLKLVLQGHMHWIEEVNALGKTKFITGGAVAGRPSWRGTRTGEEGFMLIQVKNEDVSWQYIDYGWKAASE